jgi:hypothetical protein
MFTWVFNVDGWCVLRVLHHHVSLPKPALGDHVGELVLGDVHMGVDCWRVVSVLLLHVSVLEPALLGKHLVELELGPSSLLRSISLHRVHN